jgi:hypothetical protein
MHPHDNPQYQWLILGSFFKHFSSNALILQSSSDEDQFKTEIKWEWRKLVISQVAGGFGVAYLDMRYFAPRFGSGFTARRLCCIAGGLYITLSLSKLLCLSKLKMELARKLCFKYERDLLDLDPDLRVFYLPIPALSPTSQSTLDLPYQAHGADSKKEGYRDL